MVKISVMVQQEDQIYNPYASADPHADPSAIPRHSNPLSFLSKGAFAMAVLGMMSTTLVIPANAQAAAAGNNGLSNNNDCVCKYDTTIDYFPNKIKPDYSANFRIEYFKSYKKLTILDNGEEFSTYLVLCGTPVPQFANVTNSIEIPIKSAAVTSTSLLPYIEYLGERESLHFVSAANTNFKPCLRKMYDQGMVADGTTFTVAKMLQANKTSFERIGGELDVVFMDSYNFKTALRPTLLKTLGPRTKAIYIAEQLETTPLGKLEWVELVAALYNKEHLVLNLAGHLSARYQCVKNLVAKAAVAAAPKKKVAWGYCYYNSWGSSTDCYVAVCPNYYCDLVKDAGGDLLTADQILLTPNQMFNYLSNADVWIYTDANFNRSSQYADPFFTGDLAVQFGELEVVKNKQVYDVLNSHWSDWFDDAKAEPGVVLMDLVQVISGNELISNADRKRDFLRNVFTEPLATQTARVANDCANVGDAYYTNWDTGFCTLPAETVLVPNADMDLCPTATKAPTTVDLGKPSSAVDTYPSLLVLVGAAMVLFAGMW